MSGVFGRFEKVDELKQEMRRKKELERRLRLPEGPGGDDAAEASAPEKKERDDAQHSDSGSDVDDEDRIREEEAAGEQLCLLRCRLETRLSLNKPSCTHS